MDKWNEICFLINKHSKENSKEAFFQNEVVNIFEKLGWSRFRKEIDIEKTIIIGSKETRIDILISLDSEKLFVFELKRANNPGNENVARQLISYMLNLRMEFGFFIGSNIQLFYDTPYDKKNPIKLIEIEFTENNEEGLKLIELLKKESFDKEKLIEYCNEKLLNIEEAKTKTEIINYLTSLQGNKDILQLIYQDLKTKYNPKIIDELENDIYIKIGNKSTLTTIENTYITSEKDIVLKDFPSMKKVNGELSIGKFVRQTFRELVIDNFIGSDEVEKLLRQDYSKQTFHINLPFLSLSPHFRYYKDSIKINNVNYFICSQWFETPVNNDRPYYESWLKKMKAR